jgi:hypothetical protein
MADDYADDFENYDEDFEPETPAPATAAAAAAATAAATAATKSAAGTKSSSSSPSHKSSSKTTQPPAADVAPPKGKSKHQSPAVVKRNALQSPHSRAKAGSLSSSALPSPFTPLHTCRHLQLHQALPGITTDFYFPFVMLETGTSRKQPLLPKRILNPPLPPP